MKYKKIDAIVKFFYPVAAGIEANMLETYSLLAKNGWDVTVHTTRDTHIKRNALVSYEEFRGIKIKRYQRTLGIYWPMLDWKNAGLVALHNFDVIPHMFVLAKSIIDKMLGKKSYTVALTPHGGYNPEWSTFNWFEKFTKYLYQYTLGTFLINNGTDGIRAVSTWEKIEMVKKGINEKLVNVISNGVEQEAYMDLDKLASKEAKENVKKWGKYMIQIGRIYRIKNYETALRAMVSAPKDLNYVIIGPISNVEYKQKLDKMIVDLGLQKRVFFAGVIRGVDKFYIIKKAQFMVHMALYESFCNVVHEGLSQGLPCLVANNTALPLLVKDGVNGFCIGTHDHKTLGEKINFVLKNIDTEEIKEMSKRNQKFGLEESWASVSQKMGKFYERIMQNEK